MTHTVFDQVKALIERLSPEPVCDECITDRLGLTELQHVGHKATELAGMPGFERQAGKCSLCGIEKKVIRRVARSAS